MPKLRDRRIAPVDRARSCSSLFGLDHTPPVVFEDPSGIDRKPTTGAGSGQAELIIPILSDCYADSVRANVTREKTQR